VQGGVALWDYYNEPILVGYLVLLMGYINASIWWYVLAGVIINIGKIFDLHLAKERSDDIGHIHSLSLRQEFFYGQEALIYLS